jgi:hypothetical protein
LGEIRDQTQSDRVFADAEDDRDCRGSSFGRKRRLREAAGDNHGHATADQVGDDRRQTIVVTVQPMVFDRHASTLDIVGFTEGVAERGRVARHAISRSGVNEPNDWRPCPLRPRRKRPRRRRAAEQRDELAPLHSTTSSASASSLSGIWRPSALAVLRLMASSNFVGC